MVKKTINLLVVLQLLIFAIWLYSDEIFFNIEVACVSAFLVVFSSAWTHKRMVTNGVAAGAYEEKRDILDEIDDRFDLYEEVPESTEEKTLKEVVQEEKAKIKTFNKASLKYGAKGGFSPVRMGAYLFLIFGFIALKNNELLQLQYYLPALLVGIVSATLLNKEVFSSS